VTRDYAAFVRNNRVPAMAPLRASLTALGLDDVASSGSSGNFVFCSTHDRDRDSLERRISVALDAEVLVRTRDEVRDLVANDAYRDVPGSIVFLLKGEVDPRSRVLADATGPGGEHPVPTPGALYFINPTRLPGRRALVDFESELGVRGTRRTSRVLARVLAMM